MNEKKKKKTDLEKRGRRKSSLTRRFAGLAEHGNFPSKEWVLLFTPTPPQTPKAAHNRSYTHSITPNTKEGEG